MRQRQTRYEKRVKRNEIVRDRQTTYALALTDCNDVAYAQRGSELMRAGCLIEPQRLVHRHVDAVSFFRTGATALLGLTRRRRCRLRRLASGRRHPGYVWRRRRERSDLRREQLIQLIERIRRRRGPRACTRELPIEILHPAAQIVDDAFVVDLVGDYARRNEHDEFGSVVLDVLLAEESPEYRYPVDQWNT